MNKITKISLRNSSILYIVHDYTSFTKDQIEILSKNFKKVTVLVRYKPIAEISNLLPIHALKNHRKIAAFDLSNKPKNISVIPVPLWYLPTDKGYKSLGEKHFKAVDKIIQKRNIQFDLIHAHFTWSAGYAGSKLKDKYQVPFILTAHGYDIYSLPFKNNWWKRQISAICNSADKIITVSKSNLKCIERLKVSIPINIIPNGYNSDLFYPKNKISCRKKLGIPLNKKVLLTVGRLSKIKGHKYLVQAMQIIKESYNNTLCIIVGEGPLRNTLQKQINRQDSTSNIMLVGNKPHKEINDWMNACDLFVLPSITESFGVVQIEAMACGKPIVATKNGGSEEIITSKDYGLLCNVADPHDLSKKILVALDKNWNSEKTVSYAKNFTWESITKKILMSYKRLVPS